MAKRIPMKSGAEYDALTRWKKFLHWAPGERKKIKQKYNRRERKLAKMEIRSDEGQ